MHSHDARALRQTQTSSYNRAKHVLKCKLYNMYISCKRRTKRSSTKMYNLINDDIIHCR